MNLICDGLIVAVVILCAVIGRKRGFIKTFFGLFENIVSFLIALFLARPVGNFLSERVVSPAMEKLFVRTIAQKAGVAAENVDWFHLPDACLEFLKRFGVSLDFVRETATQKAGETGEKVAYSVASAATAPVAAAIGYAAAFILLFVACLLLVKLIIKLLDLAARLPGLKFSNRLLGLLIGAVQGVFLAYLLAVLLVHIAPGLQSADASFLRQFDPDQTVVIRFLNRFDFFSLIL